MSILVHRPGLLATIQDCGRSGLQRYGIPVSGAADQVALRIANLLVGNEECDAAIEITLAGLELELTHERLVAICGADLTPAIDGKRVPCWRPVLVPGGMRLRFSAARSGCRAYLAIAGGIDLPEVLGSRSTYIRAAIGGAEGGALRRGDVLRLRTPAGAGSKQRAGIGNIPPCKSETPFIAASWFVSRDARPAYSENPVVRAIPGPEAEHFTGKSMEEFYSSRFTISVDSDRMGCRLDGERLHPRQPVELISEGVAAGTVQVPPEGSPIVLLADRQTTGGYPRIANVATVDIPLVAQLKPGDTICFRPITVHEAQRLLFRREHALRRLALGIDQMLRA